MGLDGTAGLGGKAGLLRFSSLPELPSSLPSPAVMLPTARKFSTSCNAFEYSVNFNRCNEYRVIIQSTQISFLTFSSSIYQSSTKIMKLVIHKGMIHYYCTG